MSQMTDLSDGFYVWVCVSIQQWEAFLNPTVDEAYSEMLPSSDTFGLLHLTEYCSIR